MYDERLRAGDWPSVRDIARQTAGHYGVGLEDILAARRGLREVVRARQVAHYLAVELTRRSLPEIGRALERDHTTIMRSRRIVIAQIAIDPDLREDIGRIVGALRTKPKRDLAAFVASIETLSPEQLVGAMRVEVVRHGGSWWTGDGEAVRDPARYLVAVNLHRVFATGSTEADACAAWRDLAGRLADECEPIHAEESHDDRRA